MLAYIIRRLLLMIPTLLGIMIINFVIVQFAPGGPVEQIIAQLTGTDVGATARIGGTGGTEAGTSAQQSGQAVSDAAATTSKYPRRARPRSRVHQAARKNSSASTSPCTSASC